MYTEEEAKTEWCPFILDEEFHNAPNNCLGSKCMAWRWVNGDGWADGASERQGYCGLAGKP